MQYLFRSYSCIFAHFSSKHFSLEKTLLFTVFVRVNKATSLCQTVPSCLALTVGGRIYLGLLSLIWSIYHSREWSLQTKIPRDFPMIFPCIGIKYEKIIFF